jgi:two-component system, chemotaxis family, sensor kinase CheA
MLLKNKHIFVVEDNAQNRIVFQMSLLRHGASVDFGRSADEAIFRLGKIAHVDLIVVDLMLTKSISGFELYDEIRVLTNYETIPLVAVSAMDPAVAIPQAQAKGFAGFIAKPVDNNLFPRQIAKILNGEPIWHAGERDLY